MAFASHEQSVGPNPGFPVEGPCYYLQQESRTRIDAETPRRMEVYSPTGVFPMRLILFRAKSQ